MSVLEGVLVRRLGKGLLGLDDDGLEVLAAADGAGAAAPRGAVVLVDPGGVADEVLAGLADGDDADVIAVTVEEGLYGVVDALAPEVGGVPQLDVAVLDEGVDGLLRLAAEEDAVEAGPAKASAGPAAVVGVGDGAGEGRLGDDGHAAAHGDVGAGQGAEHEAEEVVGAQGVDGGAVVEHVFNAEATGADVLAGVVFVDALVGDLTGGKVDAGDVVCVATELHLGLLSRRGGRTVCVRRPRGVEDSTTGSKVAPPRTKVNDGAGRVWFGRPFG